MKLHAYKCPGPNTNKHGIRYEIGSFEEGADLPKGWFWTLKDAAEFAGTRSLAPSKSNKRDKEARLKKLAGHPGAVAKLPKPKVELEAEPTTEPEFSELLEEETKIVEVEPIKVENINYEKVETRQYKDLTEEDKEAIKERLKAGEKPGAIGKDYDVHHLVIVAVRRELD